MHPRPLKPEGLSVPGLTWRPRVDHWVAVWIARSDLVKRGYRPKSARMWPPSDTAPIEPTADEWKAIASGCERMQSEMLEWANVGPRDWDPHAIFDGTMNSLIKVYEEDPDSPFQSLRYKTKLGYGSKLRTLKAIVGKARVPELTFRDFKRWHEGFCKPKKEGKPNRIARGHGLITTIRLVVAFGALLKLPGCKDVQETLGGMEFTNVKKRVEVVTAEQAVAIRREAHRVGLPSIALAQALVFDMMFRPKDVLGEYLPDSEPGISEVLHHGKKWLNGLHWKEVSDDLILTHRLSKSMRGREAILDPASGKTEAYDFKAYPMVMEELQRVTDRAGPIVKRESTGRPWDEKSFARAWRKIATAVGVPKTVQFRDNRAGGVTEALDAGAKPDQVRRNAGHSLLSTTMIYARDGLAAKAEVIDIRVKNRPRTP